MWAFLPSCFRIQWPPLEGEVRDELMRQHALSTCQGRACDKCCHRECQDCFWNGEWITAFGRMALSVVLSLVILLIVFGVIFVGPYFSRSLPKVTQCDVVSVESQEGFYTCVCVFYTWFEQPDCKTKSQCVKVNVEYTREDGEKVQGLLRRTEQSDQCINDRCERSSVLNMMHVYKPPHSFKCFYDPTKDITHVMINYSPPTTGPTTDKVVHILLWPIVIIILCIAMFVFLMCTCGCRWYGCELPQDIRTIAVNLRLQGIHRLQSLPVEERKRLVRECTPAPEEELQAPQMQRV